MRMTARTFAWIVQSPRPDVSGLWGGVLVAGRRDMPAQLDPAVRPESARGASRVDGPP